jgi:serine/threonine-protein kinase
MDFPAGGYAVGRYAAGPGGREHWVGGRYRLMQMLGRGGMGCVWQAFDERLQRAVAVKILDPAQSDAGQGRVEARALAQLNHPRIANVFDYGEDEGRPYLVMELVRGRSLTAILARGPLSWSAACAAGAHVASALAAAHERGVVHRDVKPGNIMVTPLGAKLIDFGISAVQGEAETEANGGFRGTPVYVAPERLQGRAVAAPSDVYALGLVLYLALCGRLPWPTGDTAEYWKERERTDPTPLPPIDGLPSDVADLCLQCLTADPARRPDAATVARVLAEAGSDGVAELGLLAAGRDGNGEATQLMGPLSIRDSKRGHPASTAKLGAVAAVAVLALALVWSTVRWSPVGDDVNPEATNAAGATECDVTLRLAAEDGERFVADIVATPRTEAFQAGWRLSLPLYSDSIDVDGTLGWTRKGAVLTSPAQPTLGVGRPTQLAFSGSHTGTIALPTTMSVDGRDCAVALIASPAVVSTAPGSRDDESSGRPPPPDARPAPPGHAKGSDNGHPKQSDDDDEDQDDD